MKQIKPNDLEELEQLIIDTTIETGKFLDANAFSYGNMEWKKTDDPVTDMDRKAENMIKAKISQSFNVNFVGEEYGRENNGSLVTIYMDPIDGTKSFIRGEFHSSLSIAADWNGEMFIGCVYDFTRGILYFADREGAYMKRASHNVLRKLPLDTMPKFSKPTFAIDGLYTKAFTDKGYSIRDPIGSIALNMAQLALGSYDGLIMKLKKSDGGTDVSDIAAGCYIMKQAGICVMDKDMDAFDHSNPGNGLIAIKPEFKEEIIRRISTYRK